MKPVDAIPTKHRPRKKQIKPEIKPIRVCPMCGSLFFQNHWLRIYCKECAEERDKEWKRKWVREHPMNVKKNYSDSRARHRGTEPVPTKGWVWDLIFGYVEDETFERGILDGAIYEEDRTYVARYAEKHNFE